MIPPDNDRTLLENLPKEQQEGGRRLRAARLVLGFPWIENPQFRTGVSRWTRPFAIAKRVKPATL